MKPSLYWQSLIAEEKAELSEKTGKSYQYLCNMFNGRAVSLEFAVEVSKHCEGLVNPIDLISESNRKAIKAIKSS